MKRIIYLCTIPLILFHISCKNGKRKTPIEQRIYQHKITSGQIDKKGELDVIKKFNTNGNIVEELDFFDANDSTPKKTTYKYNAENNLTEKTVYEMGRVDYKKIIEYTGKNRKLMRIFFGRNKGNQDLFLYASVQYYHNTNGKLFLKKFIGGIDEFGNETNLSVFDGKMFYDESDSNSVRYTYALNGKLDSVKLSLLPDKQLLLNYKQSPKSHNEPTLLTPVYKIYKYRYISDTLISEVNVGKIYYDQSNNTVFEHESKTNFKYEVGKLTEESEETENYIETTTYINQLKSEEKIFNKVEKQVISKIRYIYNSNGDVVERTEYDYLNEPIKHWSYEYLY
jgi:YD repeat-containing protein